MGEALIRTEQQVQAVRLSDREVVGLPATIAVERVEAPVVGELGQRISIVKGECGAVRRVTSRVMGRVAAVAAKRRPPGAVRSPHRPVAAADALSLFHSPPPPSPASPVPPIQRSTYTSHD